MFVMGTISFFNFRDKMLSMSRFEVLEGGFWAVLELQ